ncbi:DsbA family protein [Candidatus Peregrinibacteria bacterium]|nr:DsbA family protein [Candidatus Peregrinibacteria bacterium]
MEQNNFFKIVSAFLLGLIVGYLLGKANFSGAAMPRIEANSSVKIQGQENAPVTITEYSDFQCPLCHSFFVNSYPTILENYIKTGKVKYVYKHFPLNIHPQAPAAALASECALDQNKFWEMHDKLFENQDRWSGNPSHGDIFKQLAADIGLDQAKFNQCYDQATYKNNVDVDYNEAITNGFRGTPTFYINDQLIVGAQDTKVFTDAIDALLNK